MAHEPNDQTARPAKTAETDTGVGCRGGAGCAGGAVRAGRTGALALASVGGRRWLLTLISGAGTFALCWAGHIDGNAYTLTTIGIVGAYIGGNTAQKIKAPGAEG